MRKGFTLIETIVVIFVFSILMEGITMAILSLYRTHTYEWQQSLAVEEAKRGVETMVREIREARQGEDGSYPIELAGDKEFIFYSDIDGDGKTERVRYFLGYIDTKTYIQECQSSQRGGSCSVSFSNFLNGNLKKAEVKISVQGDLGASNEYINIYLDGKNLTAICKSGCTDCPGSWQGTQVFDVTSNASDNLLNFSAQASSAVDPSCPFSFKVKFELTITQEIQGQELKKGVIKATGFPPNYLKENEEIFVLSSYVRNSPPIFEYYDGNGNKIEEYPARLKDTKVMKIFLVVNVDPQKPPTEYQLESFVFLRNLK
jgi:prepilin-type N-terminal cleavage/methylation domain-containing protein